MAKERFSAMIETNRVAGIISDQASLEALVAELTEAGYPEDAMLVHHGQKGIETILILTLFVAGKSIARR